MDNQALRLLGSMALARAARGDEDAAALSVLKLFGSEASQLASEYALGAAGVDGLAHPGFSGPYSAFHLDLYRSGWFERYAGRSAAPSQAERPKSNATSSPSEGWACPEIEEAAVYIDYDVADRIATITLNRPEAANAQNPELLDELDAAWTRAAEDNDVSVIILRANGKHFSAGHDLRGGGPVPDKITLDFIIQHEAKRYLEYTLRWRNVPKPSIAAVQGRCISGGLLLCWPCDLIIAADDAQFSDPVVLMGIGGVEYHGHTWELGPRKAKEILFTGRAMTAEEVMSTGMVNRVVPRDELDAETRALAEQIAKMPPFALRQAKRAVNQTLDVQGFYAAIQSVFDIHQTGHGNALSVSGWPVLVNLDEMKANIK